MWKTAGNVWYSSLIIHMHDFVDIIGPVLRCGAEGLQLTRCLMLFSSCTASACVDVHGSVGAILGVWQSGVSTG